MPGEIEVASVAALTHAGEGVVRAGKTAFIAGALPGEIIRFRRTRRHRQHDEGELLEVLQPSSVRVAPHCKHFGTCGGCALQHLSPEAQLQAKHAELRESFERLAHVAPQQWLEPLRGPVWGYRRRARLGAKYVIKKGRVVVGFRERLAPYVAEVERCEVLSPPVGELVGALAELIMGLSIRERLPQIEVAVGDNAVALVLRVLDPPSAEDRRKLLEFAQAQRVRFYLQPAGLDSVRPLADEPAPPLVYRLAKVGLELEFAPTDFVQINSAVNEELVARAVQMLELSADATVLDLYCGIGNFTLALAQAARYAVGVEGDRVLLDRARGNARRNGIENVEFHLADLAQALDRARTPWMQHSFTHVLLDPPRAGARAILPAIAALAPRSLVYISCHPGSLARDVGILVHELGFVVRAAGVLDMFPHTAHVESLALLQPAVSAKS
jgi:23S rRNA (uracil1939-C5)-methyltransferase